ncbi:MAG: cupredoxin domain-containing protein, partial [Acidobacteriota bacterium]
SVVALVQGRRGMLRESATSTERSVLGIALGAVALAVLLSLVLTATSRTTVSAQAKTGAAVVDMKNYSFAPNSMQAKAGDTVRVVIKNDDTTLHTFTLPQAGVDVTVAPGSEKVVEFKAPAAGVYQWYCTPHSNANGATREGMVGTLQVQ